MRRICLAWWPFPPHDLQGAVTVALSSHLGDDSPTGVEEESLPDGSPREEGEALRQHLAVLFRSHRDVLLGQALAILRCPFDAEDAVQIAFSRALIGGRPAHALSVGYLARAVTNAARDLLRRRKSAERCRQVLSGMNAPPPDPLAGTLESATLGERIAQASATLPPGLRRVFERVVFDGAEYQELAAELGLSRVTVRQQMWRARKRIRSALEA